MHPKAVIATLAILSFVVTGQALGQSPDSAVTSSRLDSLMQRAMSRYRLAGVSVAVVRGRDTLLNKGYGLADIGLQVPASRDTRYRVLGPHLAAAVMQQVEAGRVSLDDDVAKLIHDFPWKEKRITLRQLMDASSGLPDFHYLGDAEYKVIAMPKSPGEVTALVADMPLNHEPGSSWQWTITGFHFAGGLVEQLSGMSYDEYLRQRVFAPAKLTQSHYCGERDVIPGLPRTYAISSAGPRYSPPESPTSYPYIATVCTTALDAVKIMLAMRNGTLLQPASWTAMTTAEGAAKNAAPGMSRAVGLRTAAEEGHTWVGESGTLLGFGSSVLDFAADSLTIAVLTNTSSLLPLTIARNLARSVLGLPPVPELNMAPSSELRELAPLAAEERSKYVGVYHTRRVNPPPQHRNFERTYRVFVHNNRLMLQAVGEEPAQLFHQHGDTFVIRGATVTFGLKSGQPRSIEISFSNATLKGSETGRCLDCE